MASLVVHYGEIGTKGGNRGYFEKRLQENLFRALAPVGAATIIQSDQRFLVRVEEEAKSRALDALREVFGVSWIAEVQESPLVYGKIAESASSLLEAVPGSGTFRVTARRANKTFELSSHELVVKLGEDLRKGTGKTVDLSDPQTTVYVDILSDKALLYTGKERGPGGLPVGVSGRVVHLLSGGIDSPVAAWLMMKRGCDLTYLHFYVAPRPEEILDTKMPSLVKALSRFARDSRMVLVPFAPYQLATRELPQEFEPTVFRHFMRIVAEQVAAQEGALAISSGDNLGQVASQTLYNLACIDAGSSMTTLRPLLGYDKSEIVKLAEQIGTYQNSIEDYKDCCSIVSGHPRTRMTKELVLGAARHYDFSKLAAATVAEASILGIDSPSGSATLAPLAGLAQQ